jgi:hypothetical protein
LKGGYKGLQRDLLLARDAIIAVPEEAMEDGSAKGVLRAVRSHAPVVVLRPAIGVAKGAGQILMGATNSLDKGNLGRVDDVSSPFLAAAHNRSDEDLLMICRIIRKIDEWVIELKIFRQSKIISVDCFRIS